jgi:hypothetical protein
MKFLPKRPHFVWKLITQSSIQNPGFSMDECEANLWTIISLQFLEWMGSRLEEKNEKKNKIAKRKLYCRRTSYQMTSFCFSKKQLEYNYILLLARLQWQIQVCDYVMVKTTFYSKLSRLGGWCVLVCSTRT